MNNHHFSEYASRDSRSVAGRIAVASAAVLISSTLLGSVLGLFEMNGSNGGLARSDTNSTMSASGVPQQPTQLSAVVCNLLVGAISSCLTRA